MEFGRSQLHLLLHVIVPAIVAFGLGRAQKLRALLIMLSAILIDLDHLLASPIYDPNRCSLDFHPLHHYSIHPLYLAMTLHPKTRWFGIGLLIHVALDGIDCLLM